MGSKSAIVYIGDGLPQDALRNAPPFDPVASAELAAAVLDSAVVEAGRMPLGDAVWPETGTMCAASFPDFELVCTKGFALDRPSDLTGWVRSRSARGNAYGAFMYSVYDYCSLAVWENGAIRRSLSLAPDDGIMEDLGERYPFEAEYWDGAHSLEGYAPEYPFPFHPLDLGNAAMSAWFGFCIEGYPPESGVDPWAIEIPIYRRAE